MTGTERELRAKPMRISVLKDDPGYENLQSMGGRAEVFLNGEPQYYVDTADEEQGFIVRCVLNEKGWPQADPKNPDWIWQETVYGEVRIAPCKEGA